MIALGGLRLACAIAAAALMALAPNAWSLSPIVTDDAREQRIADEVVPQLVVGDAVWLATPSRSRVLALYAAPASRARGAVVLVHGLGLNPDWGFIGTLRGDLVAHDFATLSVQMPVLAPDAPRERYRALFGDAGERLAAAVAWLRSRGHPQVAILSHSLGAAMANAFVANSHSKLDAWIAIGFAEEWKAAPTMPVLDVVGENDFPDVIARSRSRQGALPKDRCSKTVVIAHADHFFEREAKALEAAVVPFLGEAFSGRC